LDCAETPEEVAARQAIEAQHLARDDRLLAAQRSAVDSAKLVSTFVLALAGTLVGTALQVSPRGGAEVSSLILIGASLLCALTVILLDSLDIPTFEEVSTTLNDAHRQQLMQTIIDMTIKSNQKTARYIRTFALLSVGMSSIAGGVSGISLMLK
jgi:hypothetical protein